MSDFNLALFHKKNALKDCAKLSVEKHLTILERGFED